MDGANLSVVSEFVFLGPSNSWVIQLLLFLFSSAFYMAICSIAAPKMIYTLFRKRKAISFGGCITQIFFIHAVGGTEMGLLIAMAFDRHTAICKPLHYLTIVNPRICILILAAAWILGLIHSVAQLAFVIDLPFCGPNVLDSFCCDLLQLIKLACTETNRLEFMVTANSGLISVGSFSILIISYIFILVTAQKHSSGGLSKAVSTLSAHVSVVVLVFGPLIFFFIWPFPSSHLDNIFAIFDAILTLFLNPVIYTLRNKEMKAAMKKLCHQLVSYRKMS
uniref:G-protein coupled receptors family 1 profile domain-containing protein n=1 Tax=Macaca nemestrina TaxID=9545 RepID=A0A2K6B7E9_MACNE